LLFLFDSFIQVNAEYSAIPNNKDTKTKRTWLPLGYASPSNDERQHCAASYMAKTICFLLFYSFCQETAEYFAIPNNKATKT